MIEYRDGMDLDKGMRLEKEYLTLHQRMNYPLKILILGKEKRIICTIKVKGTTH